MHILEYQTFPNPVRNFLQIRIYCPANENLNLSIYDVTGKLMRKVTSRRIPKGNSVFNISDFQSWPDGIYSIKIILGNDSYVSKMIINK